MLQRLKVLITSQENPDSSSGSQVPKPQNVNDLFGTKHQLSDIHCRIFLSLGSFVCLHIQERDVLPRGDKVAKWPLVAPGLYPTGLVIPVERGDLFLTIFCNSLAPTSHWSSPSHTSVAGWCDKHTHTPHPNITRLSPGQREGS